MKNLFVIFLAMFSLESYAKCRFEITNKDVKVKWIAYKTPRKVAVQGEFKKFSFKTTNAEDWVGCLKDATFDIDSSSVSTGNPDRDKKIVNNFFTDKGKTIKISGNFHSNKSTEVNAKLEIQGTSKEVSFQTETKANTIILTTDINVLDFSLKDNLSRINLACKALHEGVTWPDVKIIIEISGAKRCD
jgi:polyisoprenoid-binding protein YceI